MNKVLISLVLVLLCVSLVPAQNISVIQLVRNTGSDPYSGSTWAASATHYTEWFDMSKYDSAHVFITFPDTVKAGVTVQGAGTTDGSTLAATNTTVDSVNATASATGLAIGFSIQDNGVLGAPYQRLKISFSANTNDTEGVEKYKIWLKRFKH